VWHRDSNRYQLLPTIHFVFYHLYCQQTRVRLASANRAKYIGKGRYLKYSNIQPAVQVTSNSNKIVVDS
ncbi:MAG: hypothetical protein ACRD5J_08835, partial [Nitrososphaeraceae archaeon]